VLAVLGVCLFGEGMPVRKVIALLLIVAGVALLDLKPAAVSTTTAAASHLASVRAGTDPVTSRSSQ
jgi:drug/metabolite transporter (DMT)-like permease